MESGRNFVIKLVYNGKPLRIVRRKIKLQMKAILKQFPFMLGLKSINSFQYWDIVIPLP